MQRLQKTLARVNQVLVQFEWVAASTALLVGLGVSIYTIAARVLRIPTGEWVLELPMEMMVITAVYGTGALTGMGRHLAVGFLVERLSPPIRRILMVSLHLFLLALCALLAQRGFTAALQAHQLNLRIPELFNLSTAIPMAVASLGIAFWGVHQVCLLTLSVAEDSRPQVSR